MLSELQIENLGVIERASLVFGRGMTVLTGETGAGKTMLVEAIELVVGGRAEAAIVRTGAAEARVDARFVVGDGDAAVEYVLSRVVPADGRSRAYIDGRLATVANLSELGRRLVDLHGQHAHQSLLTTATQRAALDRFGNVDLSALRAVRAELTEIDAALAALGGDERARAREIDLLRFQVDELAGADLDDADEERALEASEELLADAVHHREAGAAALAALTDEAGGRDAIAAALAVLGHRAPFEGLIARLRDLIAELDDIAAELRRAAEAIDEDPQRLAEVRARRQQLRDLCRKYGDTLGDVIAFQHEVQQRLTELESFDERAAELDRRRQEALVAERRAASEVARRRRHAAPALARAVEARLRELAMAAAQIVVTVGGDDGDGDPGDDVTFLLAANPGTPPQPLAKTASGGELARAMLALRLALTLDGERAAPQSGASGHGDGDDGGVSPRTLVFDEVDAGIGGAAASAVGRALAALADTYQVFVVTHLAQVAACAATQVVVDKQVVGEATSTTVTVVEGEHRVAELARMLSGEPDSDSARQHALDLLSRG
jgi:DNA repair protein RecN (Recombination protein N)